MGRGAASDRGGHCRSEPSRLHRHDGAAPARERCARRSHARLERRDRHLHHAGLSVPRRRPAVDQLPPAALDAFHAGGGLRRAGAHEGGLRPRRRRAIPLLFLRRLLFVALMSLAFELLCSDGLARRSRITTAHGTVETPAFMPVGTAGTVKAMTPQSVAETGTEIVLGNTFHLMLRPGPERMAALGGLHKFMNWPGPILTDSGGFQVMSLAKLRELDADGVTFRSPIDGSEHRLTPERSIEIQRLLDADITMSRLPADRPRYLMGVGRPAELVGAVRRGIDMFDCVMPSRAGRTAKAFTPRAEINLRNARHRDDPRPLDERCTCPACRHHSRAYLHHLVRSEEVLGAMLLTWHNLHYYQDVMRGLRTAIETRALGHWIAAFEAEQGKGDIPPP